MSFEHTIELDTVGKSRKIVGAAHVATDVGGGIVRRIEMTPANVNDDRMLGAVLPPHPGNVHADLAYASSRNEILIRGAGGSSRLAGRAVWGGAETLETLEAWHRVSL